MKCEFAFGDAAYLGVLDGKRPMEDISETGERISLWRRLPGQVTRERRAYRRDFAEFTAALENGEDTDGGNDSPRHDLAHLRESSRESASMRASE